MIQFYSSDFESSLCLPEQESVHCCRVLRLKEGDKAIVTDGKGKRFYCIIKKADPRSTQLEIISFETINEIRDYTLTIGIAPPKNIDRLEWFIEKAVEIGIDCLDIVFCERSERKIVKKDRIEKIMVSALKQSLGTMMPDLNFFTDVNSYISSLNNENLNFVGYCSTDVPLKSFVKEVVPKKNVSVLIGPEGDFSPSEIKSCLNYGIIPVSFGEKRLRTETAALFSVAAVNVINQLK